MKKILFLAMVAAALVSCSQNEEFENAGQKAEIKFGTVVKAGTKAVLTTNDNFKTFTVYAYKTAASISDPSSDLSSVFMSGVEVKKNEAGTAWETGEKKYYWPATGKVQFFATSPAQTWGTIVADQKYPNFEYTIKDEANQEDLVAANLIDEDKTSTGLVFPFRHLLSQVNITLKGAQADFIYTVSSVVIKGAKDKGTFTFNGDKTEVGAWTNQSQSNAAQPSAYTYAPQDAIVLTPTSNPAKTDEKPLETLGNALFMLMPQTLEGVTLEITYSAEPSDDLGNYTYNDTKTLNLTGTWGIAQNIRYTLELSTDASPIEFKDPTVGGWTNETGTPTTPTAN